MLQVSGDCIIIKKTDMPGRRGWWNFTILNNHSFVKRIVVSTLICAQRSALWLILVFLVFIVCGVVFGVIIFLVLLYLTC